MHTMKSWLAPYVITVLAHVQLSEATGLSKPDGITIDTDVDTQFSDFVAERILCANLLDPACKRPVSDIGNATGQTDNRVIRWIQDKLETSDSDTTISQLDLAHADWILEHISHVVKFKNEDKLVVVITGWMDGRHSVNYTTRTRKAKGVVRTDLGEWKSDAKLNQKHKEEREKKDGDAEERKKKDGDEERKTKDGDDEERKKKEVRVRQFEHGMYRRNPKNTHIYEGTLRHMVKIVNEEGNTVGLVAVMVSGFNDKKWFMGRSKKESKEFDLYSPRFDPAEQFVAAQTFVPTQNFSDKLSTIPAMTDTASIKSKRKSKRNLRYAETRGNRLIGYSSVRS